LMMSIASALHYGFTTRPPRRPTLFPYTTLLRSRRRLRPGDERRGVARELLGQRGGRRRALLSEGREGGDALVGGAEFRERVEFRSEEHTSELQSRENLVCRLLLEKKKRE